MLEIPAEAFQFASGVSLSLLGAGLLTLRPRRAQQVAFGIFAILWGLQISAANFGPMLQRFDQGAPLAYVEIQAAGLLTSYALLGPAALLLVHFASLSPHFHSRAATWLTAIMAAAGAITLFVAPERVLESIETSGSRLAPRLGPLALPLFVMPFYGAFYLALIILYAEYRRAGAGMSRDRARSLLLALSIFTSYAATANLIVFGRNLSTVVRASAGVAQGMTALFFVGMLVVIGMAAHLALRPPKGSRRDAVLLLALLGPAAVAIGHSLFGGTGQLVGIARFVTVVILVHALARQQLFDLDLRIKRGAKRSLIAGAILAVFFVVSEGAETLISDRWGQVFGLAVAGILTFALRPLERIASRVVDSVAPGVRETPDYVDERKRQVYHAAFESAMRDGEVTDRERATLNVLVSSLGLRPHEAEAIERDVIGSLQQAPSVART